MDALAGKLKELLDSSGEHACQLAVYRDGGLVCAICAAPTVLAAADVLEDEDVLRVILKK